MFVCELARSMRLRFFFLAFFFVFKSPFYASAHLLTGPFLG